MALNLDIWSGHEIIKDAIGVLERSASKDLVTPVLRVLKKIRRNTRIDLRETFHLWVPKDEENFYVPDLFYTDYQETSSRCNQSWASFQPARLGLVFPDPDTCNQVSRMMQVLGKLANISNQQRPHSRSERWVLLVKKGCLEITESNVVSLVGFSSRENALLAWDTLTEEEQATFCKGFENV